MHHFKYKSSVIIACEWPLLSHNRLDPLLFQTFGWDLSLNAIMGESFQDYSWIQDFQNAEYGRS